ncbi:MAG: prolyl oligopeptidase family serine peptidase [Planctomycetes bacterium]|nr:prolyl oligopeptidase family serine peptidase [Planctomycetota bacterium]
MPDAAFLRTAARPCLLIAVALLLGGARLHAQDAASAPTDEATSDDVHPRLDEIFRPPRLLGVRPDDATLSADGRWATWRWTSEDAEKPQRDLWIGRTDGSEARVLFAHDVSADVRWERTGAELLVERDGWLFRLAPERDAPLEPLLETGGSAQIELLDDGRRALVVAGESHQVWVLDLLTGRRITPAATLRDRAGRVTLLEHAGLVALFAHPPADGEAPPGVSGVGSQPSASEPSASDAPGPRALWLVDLDGVRPPRRTEVLDDEGQALVSPSGRWVVRRSSHAEQQRQLVMADYLGDVVRTVGVRSSLAGDDASPVSLQFVESESGREVTLDLGGSQRFYLLRLDWSPVDDLLLVERLSNDFHVRELLLADPASGEVRQLLGERDEAWIGGPARWARFADDGRSVLFTSERTGFEHLWTAPVDGAPARQLTHGDWELHALRTVPHGARVLGVGTAPDDPATHRLVAIDVDGGRVTTLSDRPGCASDPIVSEDGSTAVFTWEELGVPGDLFAVRFAEPRPTTPADEASSSGANGVRRTLSGAPVAAPPAESRAEADVATSLLADAVPMRLTLSVPDALEALALPPPEIVTFPSDDVRVHAYLYRPEPFEPGRVYPAVIFVHGAGSLQNVLRSMSAYDVNMLFHHRLARKGYVVLDVDYRHSTGYGRDFRAAIHGFMGGKDLDDLVAGVDYLDSLGFVDRTRVGLYGGSYGGFLTLMALFTKPEVFACGAALRSVTDWRTYNHWYTNARLGDPEKDAAAYAKSSPIDHAEGLTRPLLLLHGLLDDNVFAQDTIRLVEKLIQLGKDFDLMLYPSQHHGFDDPESWIDEYRRIERLFDEQLAR